MATAPSSTVARQTVSAGLKNSDFHDAGPTAQSKSSGSPVARTGTGPEPGRRASQPTDRRLAQIAVDDGAITGDRPNRPVPALGEQRAVVPPGR